MIFNPGIVPPSKGGGAVEFVAGPIVTTGYGAAMNFDLSQVDMTKVAALFFTFSISAGLGDAALAANGVTVATVCSNNSSISAGIAWLVPMNGKVACFVTNAINKGGDADESKRHV